MVYSRFEAYVNFVASRTKDMGSPEMDKLHAAVGGCTESGELLDQVKAHVFYNKPLDMVNVVEELGDQLFYFVMSLRAMGLTLDQIMDFNQVKLEKRYPKKYSDADAIARADKVVTS